VILALFIAVARCAGMEAVGVTLLVTLGFALAVAIGRRLGARGIR